MKSPFISDLAAEQTILTFFLVNEKEIRNTRAGKSYLRLELGDRTGAIEAVMWDQAEATAKDIGRGDVVKVNARVESYRNKLQLTLQQLRLAKPEEVDLADFLPHTKEDLGKLWAQLLDYANSIQNPWLKKLVNSILADPAIAARYKRAPAAKVMHHAYLGGLLEHVVGLCGLAKQIAAHYPELNADLLMTVAILHDVGKLEELCYDRAISYTTEGQLLGHIVMELETVSQSHGRHRRFSSAFESRRPASPHQPSRPVRIRLAQTPHDSRSPRLPLPRRHGLQNGRRPRRPRRRLRRRRMVHLQPRPRPQIPEARRLPQSSKRGNALVRVPKVRRFERAWGADL